ncbi:MAG: signal peptidase II [Lachnospiraceae bacterium]|nr:signal peptidase II [Lachnospiraceae bacterium]
MNRQAKKYAGCILLLVIFVVLDQLTKGWAVRTLQGNADIEVIKGVFSFHYLENTGMAFGLLKNQQLFFYIMTAVILAAVCWFFVKTPPEKRYLPLLLFYTMIAGGAIGNLIDRALNQYVVDFLYVSAIDFPVFNVADCFVTVGCILLMIWFIFVYKDEELSFYSFRKKNDGAV